jgi:hypothetical protein
MGKLEGDYLRPQELKPSHEKRGNLLVLMDDAKDREIA